MISTVAIEHQPDELMARLDGGWQRLEVMNYDTGGILEDNASAHGHRISRILVDQEEADGRPRRI